MYDAIFAQLRYEGHNVVAKNKRICQIEKGLNHEIVCSGDELKYGGVVHVDEISVPLANIVSHVVTFQRLLNLLHGLIHVVCT